MAQGIHSLSLEVNADKIQCGDYFDTIGKQTGLS